MISTQLLLKQRERKDKNFSGQETFNVLRYSIYNWVNNATEISNFLKLTELTFQIPLRALWYIQRHLSALKFIQ